MRRARNQRRIRQWKITPCGLGPMIRDIILFVVFILIFLPPGGGSKSGAAAGAQGLGGDNGQYA